MYQQNSRREWKGLKYNHRKKHLYCIKCGVELFNRKTNSKYCWECAQKVISKYQKKIRKRRS